MIEIIDTSFVGGCFKIRHVLNVRIAGSDLQHFPTESELQSFINSKFYDEDEVITKLGLIPALLSLEGVQHLNITNCTIRHCIANGLIDANFVSGQIQNVDVYRNTIYDKMFRFDQEPIVVSVFDRGSGLDVDLDFDIDADQDLEKGYRGSDKLRITISNLRVKNNVFNHRKAVVNSMFDIKSKMTMNNVIIISNEKLENIFVFKFNEDSNNCKKCMVLQG